jgi:hypothetical protein
MRMRRLIESLEATHRRDISEGKTASLKIAPTALSFFQTDVMEPMSDPDEYGLSGEEQDQYRTLLKYIDFKKGTLKIPTDEAENEKLFQVLRDMSNGADDIAEYGHRDGVSPEERKFHRIAGKSIWTLAAGLLKSKKK